MKAREAERRDRKTPSKRAKAADKAGKAFAGAETESALDMMEKAFNEGVERMFANKAIMKKYLKAFRSDGVEMRTVDFLQFPEKRALAQAEGWVKAEGGSCRWAQGLEQPIATVAIGRTTHFLKGLATRIVMREIEKAKEELGWSDYGYAAVNVEFDRENSSVTPYSEHEAMLAANFDTDMTRGDYILRNDTPEDTLRRFPKIEDYIEYFTETRVKILTAAKVGVKLFPENCNEAE